MNMVMSMDAAGDQSLGSPMEDSTSLHSSHHHPNHHHRHQHQHVRHQESADDDQNEDEQSKASGQTIVGKTNQQQLQLDDATATTTTTIQAPKSVQRTDGQQKQQQQDASEQRMLVSREASLDDDSKIMVTDDTNQQHKGSTQDPVTRMQDIVAGRTEHPSKNSSGDSLNHGTTENNSKASQDSAAQQKRSRHAHHCSRHHHHHHHHNHHHQHRQSVGTIASQTSCQHHRHHQKSGPGVQMQPQQQQAHHHHHRHHHHHNEHQQPSGAMQSGTSSSERISGRRVSSSQRPEMQGNSAEAVNNENTSQYHTENRCAHYGHHHHHHHHAHGEASESHQPHHHHYHNHSNGRHHHHHHHHNRKYKKRLVLDNEGLPIADATSEQQQENRPSTITGSEYLDDNRLIPNNEELQAHDEDSNQADKRRPLQELETNVTSSANPCPYHDHHCPNHDSQRESNLKILPHHHHHHHHHQHHHRADKDVASAVGDQQQASASHRGHHHHHHRHHHHHHNHPHHSRQRNRKHRSSSNKNLDEQISGKELDIDRNDQVVMDDYDRRQSQPISAFQHQSSEDKLVEIAKEHSVDNRMVLDDEGQQHAKELTEQAKCEENNDVVSMDMSPNNEKPKNVNLALTESEALGNSTTTGNETDLITSIEIFPNQKGAKFDQEKGTGAKETFGSQARDSDISAKGDSGNKQSTRNESTHEFTRSREGDSIKGHNDKSNRLVRQASSSRENSQKENSRKAGSNLGQDQQLIECSSTQSDSLKPSHPKQIIESTVSTDRRCRLCWCCCCPCSALSNRNSQNKSEAKPVVAETSSSPANKCPILPNVPLETIRSWSDSFDRLMKCPDGRKAFQEFLRLEYSEENILFWIACEELKNEKDAKAIVTKARDIYEDYISILSAKEVSLDSRVRDIINTNIKMPTSNIFDEAQLQIYTLMHRDSYPRFINSPMYKKLAQIQTSSRKSST